MKTIFTLFLLVSVHVATAQVGIGTTSPHASAQLEILSSEKGILIPRVTQANRPGSPGKATPTEGLMVYQTDNDPGFYYFDGTNWEKLVKKSDRPSNSFAGKNPSLPQVISASTQTPITFNLTTLSSDVTGDPAINPSSFTVQTTGLYQITYSLLLQGLGTPWAFLLPSNPALLPADQTLLQERFRIASLDQMSISSSGVLNGQVTVQLDALTSIQLIIVSPSSDFFTQSASLSITKL